MTSALDWGASGTGGIAIPVAPSRSSRERLPRPRRRAVCGLHSGAASAALLSAVGQAASIAAARLTTVRTRSVAVKARVVRHRAKGGSLRTHLTYLRRDGVAKDGTTGRMFDAERAVADHRAFAERCEGDRHHFR